MNISPAITRAKNAWNDDLPEWVSELAEACDKSSQNKVGKQINYSGAVVSLVLNRSYTGDLVTVEKAVRGALMKETVSCPVLHELPKHECLANQKKPFSSANSVVIRLYKACRNDCPHSQGG